MIEVLDALVVGAGFSGAVTARQLAEAGKKVLLLEQRNQIGGNMYDSMDENGVLVHWYGPHIFHTNSKEVYEYLGRFTGWIPYEHRVLGKMDGRLVPIPFNFRSLEELYPLEEAKALEETLRTAFPGREKVSVLDLVGSGEDQIKAFGQFVLEKVFLHYTAKQWGLPLDQVDRSVVDRVPVVLGYDDRYFQDQYQAMPKNGYTALFECLLNHSNITIRLNCDACSVLTFDQELGEIQLEGERFFGPVIYTGALDQLFGYKYGPLPYRSLRLAFEQLEETQFQPAAVVNYPNEEDFTRITEFKQLTGQMVEGKTTILREYPMSYDPHAKEGNIPYYVINSLENQALYQQYRGLADRFPQLHLCGRLAEYRYYNMDGAVLQALKLSRDLLVK